MLRQLDLFSGIGGFALACRWLDIETVGFCEIDPWCRRVLAKNFPGVPQHDDVRTLSAELVREWGGCDLITGGYPCQPFSLAGQRRGAEDDRHLWPHMRRVIDEVRPRFILAENVAGHISMGLDTVLAEMEADGYTVGAVVVPAGAVNALHRRDRVWIMAHAKEGGDGLQLPGLRAESARRNRGETVPDTERRRQRIRRGIGDDGGAHRSEAASNAFTPREAGTVANSPSIGERDADVRPDALRRCGEAREAPASGGVAGQYGVFARPGRGCGIPAAETSRSLGPRADGLPFDVVRSRWADGSWERDLPRVIDDEPDRRRKLMAAGNAIVPQIAFELLRVMTQEAA